MHSAGYGVIIHWLAYTGRGVFPEEEKLPLTMIKTHTLRIPMIIYFLKISYFSKHNHLAKPQSCKWTMNL